jgi:predicted phage terminase large subunit-like protein
LFPDEDIIVAAYSASLAKTFSRFARNIVRDSRYSMVFPGTELSKETQSVDEWGLEGCLGKSVWVGIGGSITGRGGALIVIDDFFKSRQEAESEVYRERVWDSIRHDILTRRAPVSIVIILATPWHVDDPFGRIKKEMADDENFPHFEELIFPAWTETTTANGEVDRQYLFSARFNDAWYKSQEATLGTYGTASLLLCNPVPQHGGMFNVDRINEIEDSEFPDDIPYSRGWDLASSSKQVMKDDPDYTVGVKMGIRWTILPETGQKIAAIYIRDIVRDRWEATLRDNVIKGCAVRDGAGVVIGVETFGAYKDAYTTLQNALHGIRTVKKLALPGDKVSKWNPLLPIFEAGNVYIPKNAPWKQAFIDEFKLAPGGKHDDIIDAAVVAYYMHSPYQTHVIGTVEPTIPFRIQFEKISRQSTLCLSQWVNEEMVSSVVAALWNCDTNQLWVFDELAINTASSEIIVPILTQRLRAISKNYINDLKMFTWYGNNLMFARQKSTTGAGLMNIDGMWASYQRQKINLRDNTFYDEYGSILLVSRLISQKRLTLHRRCEETHTQLSTWCIDGGRPAAGHGLARAICNLVSALSEGGKIKKVAQPIPPYSPLKEKIMNDMDRADRAGVLGEYLANNQDIDFTEDGPVSPDDWMKGGLL